MKTPEGVRKAFDDDLAKFPGTETSDERGECDEELSGLIDLGSFAFLFRGFLISD